MWSCTMKISSARRAATFASRSRTMAAACPPTCARAFEPFFTTKEVGKGTGLGLSMVYGFVRQSGGQLTIESTVGAGTSVTLYLPKAAETSDDETQAHPPPAVPVGSERVLVVDDDEHLLQVQSDVLTELGYRVRCARNGAEALQMIESGQEFELLFSDVVMPCGMNGVELARRVRALNNNIKILLTSGYADDVLQ